MSARALAPLAIAACWRADAAPRPVVIGPAAPATTLQLVVELEALLERDIAVDEVARAVGSIAHDSGSAMAIELLPRSPRLASARLARYPLDDAALSGAVYLLDVALARGTRPTFGELAGAFGAGHPGRGLHGERFTIFYPPSRGRHWSVAVIAELSSCFDPHSDAEPAVPIGPCTPIEATSRVETISFRRDPAQ